MNRFIRREAAAEAKTKEGRKISELGRSVKLAIFCQISCKMNSL